MDPPVPSTHVQNEVLDANAPNQANGQQLNHPPGTANVVPVPDLNSLPQADLSTLPPLQGLPTDISLLPMMAHDGTLLTDQDLMNMPLMMPMVMDGNGMPNMPQNGITNGTSALIYVWHHTNAYIQMRSPFMIDRFAYGDYRRNRRYATLTCYSSP